MGRRKTAPRFRTHAENVVLGVARILEATAVASTVSTGDFVRWRASRGAARGRIVSIHTSSKVPGVAAELVGTADQPAARVRLYAPSGNGWTPTDTYVPLPTSALAAIDALPEPTLTEAVSTPGSFDEIREKVRSAIRDRLEKVTGAENVGWIYVSDIGPDWCVYELCDDLYLVSYTVDDAGAVVLGDATEVCKQTVYVPAVEEDTTGQLAEAVNDRIEGRLLEAKGVDAAGGRVYRVQIIQVGDSKNGVRYTESVLRAAAPLYEGAKAFDHHRTPQEMTSSTINGLVGTYRSVESNTAGLEADLHLLPSASHVAEALDKSIENQAAGLPPLVGISHDVAATRKQITGPGGRRLVEATQILAVFSADVVADPSAGGHATRMVAGGIGTDPHTSPEEENTLNLKQLLALLRTAESARRAELLTEHAPVLTAAGITADEALRLAEAVEPAPALVGGGDRLTEATYGAASTMGRLLVERAVSDAKLPVHLVEAVLVELGDTFTEADIAARVSTVAKLAEGFERAGLAPTVPALDGVTGDERDKKIAAWNATMDGDYSKGYSSFKEAFLDITGTQVRSSNLSDLNRLILRESMNVAGSGVAPMTYDSAMRFTESFETSSWGSILGDSVTRRMVAEYGLPQLQNWRQLVSSIVPVNDFRTQKIQRMGGYGTIPTVLEGAPYQPLTSPDDDSDVTYAIAKKGGTEDLTLEMIANDDLRAITRIPRALGRGAALTLHRFVWDSLILNNTDALYDTVVLYHATHGNTTSTALSGAAVSASRKKLMTQAAYGVSLDILGLEPKFLVTCATLEELAFEICTSAVAMPSGAPVGAASNTPNIHQGLTPIILPHRDATSTTEWYIIADPALCPTVELGFYQGKEEPELFTQVDATTGSVFTADKMTFKLRHIYGGSILDYRGFQRGNS